MHDSQAEQKLRKKIRNLILLFIIGLVLSGVTAFPIETQLAIAYNHIDLFPAFLKDWLSNVYHAVQPPTKIFHSSVTAPTGLPSLTSLLPWLLLGQ